MTPDQEKQYREDFESMRSNQSTMSVSFNILQKKTACGDYEDFATQVAWMGYLSARKKAQEEIDKLRKDLLLTAGRESLAFNLMGDLNERDELIKELCKHVFKIRMYCSDHWGIEVCNVYEKAKKLVGEK